MDVYRSLIKLSVNLSTPEGIILFKIKLLKKNLKAVILELQTATIMD